MALPERGAPAELLPWAAAHGGALAQRYRWLGFAVGHRASWGGCLGWLRGCGPAARPTVVVAFSLSARIGKHPGHRASAGTREQAGPTKEMPIGKNDHQLPVSVRDSFSERPSNLDSLDDDSEVSK
eukprot:COSAG02_NODE_19348_length_886_cov_1.223634_1_plen_125_part_01